MAHILSDISNKLHNTSDTPAKPDEITLIFSMLAIFCLTGSLGLVLLTSIHAIRLKLLLPAYVGDWETLRNPEEQARKREFHEQGLKRRMIRRHFALFPWFMLFTVYFFVGGTAFTMFLFNAPASFILSVAMIFAMLLWERKPYCPSSTSDPQRVHDRFLA